MDPSHSYYRPLGAPARSGNYYNTAKSSVLSTTMGVAHIPFHEEPTDWNIKIRDAKRKRAEARTLLKAADEDLNNDADDDNANIIKNDAERVLKRTPVLLRYFEAMAKSEKADADKTISSDKKEEFRRSADTCKKALDDYDKTEGQGGKEIKKD